jgi:hypothetical protein
MQARLPGDGGQLRRFGPDAAIAKARDNGSERLGDTGHGVLRFWSEVTLPDEGYDTVHANAPTLEAAAIHTKFMRARHLMGATLLPK